MKSYGSVYLSAGDSGAKFEIVDEGNGPQINIKTSAWGNLQQELKIFTTKKSLTALAGLFEKAGYEHYSPPYCNKAEIRELAVFDDSDEPKGLLPSRKATKDA